MQEIICFNVTCLFNVTSLIQKIMMRSDISEYSNCQTSVCGDGSSFTTVHWMDHDHSIHCRTSAFTASAWLYVDTIHYHAIYCGFWVASGWVFTVGAGARLYARRTYYLHHCYTWKNNGQAGIGLNTGGHEAVACRGVFVVTLRQTHTTHTRWIVHDCLYSTVVYMTKSQTKMKTVLLTSLIECSAYWWMWCWWVQPCSTRGFSLWVCIFLTW